MCPFYVRMKSFFGHKIVLLLSQFAAPSTQGALVDTGGVVDLQYADGFRFGFVRVFAGHDFSQRSIGKYRIVQAFYFVKFGGMVFQGQAGITAWLALTPRSSFSPSLWGASQGAHVGRVDTDRRHCAPRGGA